LLHARKLTVSSAPFKGDLTGVFGNVVLVNKVVGVSVGIENAHAVAEAVRACGGVDEFL
jgi:hypothetical protein